MKRVITYGTFDLLHYGHINLLKRAKELGDYLIVGVTSSEYDMERGKLNVCQSLTDRIENVKRTGLVDEVIVEEYEGQKIYDIMKYDVDTFVIGSDWLGKFDYLKEYCQVIYLERTKGVSSTQLRDDSSTITSFGMIGTGRIARRFVLESKYVSGINIEAVYNPRIESAKKFADEQEICFYTDKLEELFEKASCIYIASPHETHFGYIMKALDAGKHVLCEKPITLCEDEAVRAYAKAKEKGLVLLHAIKTAYSPAFKHLIAIAKSGVIGRVVDVEASFTKLTKGDLRELDKNRAGGSVYELANYSLLPIFRIFGTNYDDVTTYSYIKNDIDMFSKAVFKYPRGTASFKVGLGAKTEGELIISGTKGYIYVPAPWWKTEYFEVRYENPSDNKKYFYKFDGDGLRYEILEFIDAINNNRLDCHYISNVESIAMCRYMEMYGKGNYVTI